MFLSKLILIILLLRYGRSSIKVRLFVLIFLLLNQQKPSELKKIENSNAHSAGLQFHALSFKSKPRVRLDIVTQGG